MNIAETKTVRRQTQAIDLERFRLRGFVESLGPDEIETRADPVDLADVADVFEGNPKAVLFRAVGPERQACVGELAQHLAIEGFRLGRSRHRLRCANECRSGAKIVDHKD